MGILGRWFGLAANGGDAAPPPPWPPQTADTTIAYDPTLLDTLKHEHRELLALYTQIRQLLRAGRHAELAEALDSFREHLRAHALNESQQLYGYFAQTMPEDSHDAELLRKLRREMNAISHAAAQFASRYRNTDFADPAQRQAFTNDYAAVGQLLAQRIKREETSLFPLYLPH